MLMGVPILAALGVLAPFLLRSPPAVEIPAVQRAIPAEWLAPHDGEREGTEADTSASPGTISGTLEIDADGRKIGEEAYEISMSTGGGIRMSSRGTKMNCASLSMNRLISQGPATRSMFPCSRITHFIPLPPLASCIVTPYPAPPCSIRNEPNHSGLSTKSEG